MGAAHQALLLHYLHHMWRKREEVHITAINVMQQYKLKALTDKIFIIQLSSIPWRAALAVQGVSWVPCS